MLKKILSEATGPGKRSDVSRGAIMVAGGALVVLAFGALWARFLVGPVAWVFVAIALGGLAALVLRRPAAPVELSEDELLAAAQEAIRQETDRLDARRADLERVLMSYGEWMEFPDFETLRQVDWATPIRSERDAEVAALLDAESDRVLQKFSSGAYFEGGQFQTRLLLLELWSFMEQISRIYQPDSERPILETNLESLLKAVNRASLQVILLLEEVPLVEAKELNLRKMSDGVRKASKVIKKYDDLQPYLEPVRYLWQGSKFLLASNPLLAAGWIAGSQLFWKGSKRIGKRALDGYLLGIVRQTLGIIAWETSSIYDKTHRYRNPDWVFGVELAHLVSRFPLTRDTLHEALKVLGSIPLRSSYDRIFLYRCVARHHSPKPDRFAQAELLTLETRQMIVERLVQFRDKHVDEAKPRELEAWRMGVAKRLGIEGGE